MKQTAVEWLVEKLAKNGILHSSDIAKAKEMEKQQKIEFAKNCLHENDCFFVVEQYYNETFKSE